MYRNKK